MAALEVERFLQDLDSGLRDRSGAGAATASMGA